MLTASSRMLTSMKSLYTTTSNVLPFKFKKIQLFIDVKIVLVNHTVLEIFCQDLRLKALVLVNPTVQEIFCQDLQSKAIVLVNPTVLEILIYV